MEQPTVIPFTSELFQPFIGGQFRVEGGIGLNLGEIKEIAIKEDQLVITPAWLAWQLHDGTMAYVRERPFVWNLQILSGHLFEGGLAKLHAQYANEDVILVAPDCSDKERFYDPAQIQRFGSAA